MSKIVNITTDQARQMIRSGHDLLLLDVREPAEHDAGNIPNSVNMPWNSGRVHAHYTELPHKPILIYCASGYRSVYAARFLLQQGFTEVYNLLGGYHAWK